MDYDYNDRKQASVYSRRLKAGKRRTYFFDVRETRGNDFFLTITESRKRFNEDGYDRHKIFLYKEDFNKFLKALGEAVDHVKTELMPNYDFDSFSHEGEDQEEGRYRNPSNHSDTGNSYNKHNNSSFNDQKSAEIAENTDAAGPEHQDKQAESQQNQQEVDTAAIKAEPMEEKIPESVDITNAEKATSDKLASEEVEKW